MKKKLEFFNKSKTKIHVICFDGIFYNGYIYDLTSEKDLMVFKDDKLGSVPILFEEIRRVEPFMGKEK